MQNTSPTIDDLITRGIPGAILVASIIVGTLGEPPSFDSNVMVLGFLAVSYTAGTLLDLHKHDVFTAPPHFRRILYSADSQNEEYLRGISRLHLLIRRSSAVSRLNQIPYIPDISSNVDYGQESVFSDNGVSIVEAINNKENVEVSPGNLKEAWIAVEGEASPELNRVGRNEHTVYHFLLNFFLSVSLSIIMIVYGIAVGQIGTMSVVLLLVLPVLVLFFLEINLFARYGARYSKRIVKKYYELYSAQ